MSESDPERIRRELVRILLTPPAKGLGPIRMEDWNTPRWSQAQREAYGELRELAGLYPAPGLDLPGGGE